MKREYKRNIIRGTDCSFWLEKVKLHQDLGSKLRGKLHKEEAYEKNSLERISVGQTPQVADVFQLIRSSTEYWVEARFA